MHEYDIVMDFIRKTVYLLGTALYKINHVQNEILHRKISNTILAFNVHNYNVFSKTKCKTAVVFQGNEMKNTASLPTSRVHSPKNNTEKVFFYTKLTHFTIFWLAKVRYSIILRYEKQHIIYKQQLRIENTYTLLTNS